jgi:hypothetical protein
MGDGSLVKCWTGRLSVELKVKIVDGSTIAGINLRVFFVLKKLVGNNFTLKDRSYIMCDIEAKLVEGN